ncbi:SRPBCC family protein [Penaeicola halotolerans]|uniref:SRPBCC family protein n=1 Tax=Penaeicola halotolerans TaxID=2793196 RepID=UPI001CF90F5E|nr:hypothetical protein [Penaeicola halotolerans]
MHIQIQTEVSADHLSVKEGFTQDLFLKLNPPFPPVKLLKFDGCDTGDQVSLELNFIFFKQRWDSLITEDRTDEQIFMFVDEGVKLPFFLKYWKHRHIVEARGDASVIIDDISFKAPFLLLTWLLYPVLYLQFLYRKPIYKRVFTKKARQ